MDLIYIIAQAFGIFATLCCFAMPLFKKKWQMLMINIGGNLFFILNLLLLGLHTGDLFANATAMIVNVVSLVQVLILFLKSFLRLFLYQRLQGRLLWHLRRFQPLSFYLYLLF